MVWTAMKCIHHHPHCNHNEDEHEGTKCLMSDKELEALLAENWRMRSLLEQNIKLLENLSELWTTFLIRRLPSWSNLGLTFAPIQHLFMASSLYNLCLDFSLEATDILIILGHYPVDGFWPWQVQLGGGGDMIFLYFVFSYYLLFWLF